MATGLATSERFVVEAHRRGIAVLVDMVLNHVSSEHPWFREALGGPSAFADYLRRDRDRVVLLVANVGTAAARAVTLISPAAALSPGTYAATRLLQPGAVPNVVVGADGRIRGYVPVTTIAPLETWILELH